MVIVKPGGGLCNKMRVINTFFLFAKETGQQMFVIWQEDSEFCCGCKDIFSLPKRIVVVHISGKGCRIQKKLSHLFMKSFNALCKRYGVSDDYICNNRGIIEECLKKRHIILADTCEALFEQKECTVFQPSDEVLKRVERIRCHFGKRVVGVHVRRTDNLTSIENSPLELFTETMQQELAIDSMTQFFLATDDEAVRTELCKIFGERIIYNKDAELSRKTKNGEIDAYVDLLLLASTSKILGSYWSSFSNQAAVIGGVPIQIVRKTE